MSAPSQALLLAMLADARLPTGAHTQSAGLEPALRAGLDPADVPAYIAARLRTVAAVEAGTAVVARHVALAGGDLAAVEEAWAARTPSAALRESSRRLGRGYVRLLERLWPDGGAGGGPGAPGGGAGRGGAGDGGRAGEPTVRRRPVSRPVALGLIAARAGLDAANVARQVGYDDAQTVAAATLKLAPVDPVTTTRWVFDAHPLVEDLAARVAHLTDPAGIPAGGAPLVELWAELHATTTERLFSA
ncbi:urease accessory protein UreF [Georgenia sp. EYE_87]|uniref:urease accessory protein UreF n=1 Tax=Georgenia sp. EYE_87 TaxID=2853448 RepID=UPI0020052D37|nr:urease accessory UreF family protein [Georgenia sp. EYE_87]MCK6212495.1 urease accessory protein UreF [Georgenia sp. EYE_87]